MGKLDDYKVDLKGLGSDTVSYRWQAGNDFFSSVQGPEIRHGLLDVALRVKQVSDAYELDFQLHGTVEVTCDRCLEPMDCPIDAQYTLRVKMGDDYADDGDIVTIPEHDGCIDVAWHIYEIAALQIPLRHVHPEGACEADFRNTSDEGEESDPRWDALKNIVISKK